MNIESQLVNGKLTLCNLKIVLSQPEVQLYSFLLLKIPGIDYRMSSLAKRPVDDSPLCNIPTQQSGVSSLHSYICVAEAPSQPSVSCRYCAVGPDWPHSLSELLPHHDLTSDLT